MPHAARHARHARRTAALLPGLLILAVGGALGGMAALPGPASADSTSVAPSALAAGHAASPTPDAQDATLLVRAVASERRDERASRDRRPAPLPATPPPAPAVAPAPPPPPPPAPAVAPAPPPPPPPPQFVRPGTGRLTSSYGPRWGRLHAGIDLAAGIGAPISAVAAGTVASAGTEGGYGHIVRLQHDDGTLTLYAHLSDILVTAGQRVTAGTYLGREGSSGHSTGPHLHFEVRVADVPVDPEPWLRARGVDPAAH